MNSNVKKDETHALRKKSFQSMESVSCAERLWQNKLPVVSFPLWRSSQRVSVTSWKELAQRQDLVKAWQKSSVWCVWCFARRCWAWGHEFSDYHCNKRMGLLNDGLAVDSWVEEELLYFISRGKWKRLCSVCSSVLDLKLKCAGHFRWLELELRLNK